MAVHTVRTNLGVILKKLDATEIEKAEKIVDISEGRMTKYECKIT